MNKMSVFFVVLTLLFSANHFARSTVAEKSDVMTNTSSMDEERGRQVITLLGKEIPVIMPEPVKQIVETQQKPITLFGQKIWPVPTEPPPEKQIKLLGVAIPVSAPVQNPVPDVVAQEASQGNIRNHFAVDIEKMKQRQSTIELETQPGQTSSARGTLLSTMTEAGPSDPRANEVSQGLRGVKRKMNSRDEEIKDAPRKVPTGGDDVSYIGKSTHSIDVCMNKWKIGYKAVEERHYELLQGGLPKKFLPHRSRNMALGSIYFERGLPSSTGQGNFNLRFILNNERLKTKDIENLGLEFDKVEERALFMYSHEPFQPRTHVVVDMAIGMEYYGLLQKRNEGFL